MSDTQGPPVQGEPNPPGPVGDDGADQGKDGAPVEEKLTRAEVDKLIKARTEALERKLKALQKPPQPDAKQDAPDPEAIRADADKRADLALELVAAGMSKEMARKVARADALLPESWDTPDEAVSYVKEQMPAAFGKDTKPKPPGGGGGRNSDSGVPSEWTPEAIDEAIRTGTYEKHRDQILAYQRSRASIVETIAPGSRLKTQRT